MKIIYYKSLIIVYNHIRVFYYGYPNIQNIQIIEKCCNKFELFTLNTPTPSKYVKVKKEYDTALIYSYLLEKYNNFISKLSVKLWGYDVPIVNILVNVRNNKLYDMMYETLFEDINFLFTFGLDEIEAILNEVNLNFNPISQIDNLIKKCNDISQLDIYQDNVAEIPTQEKHSVYALQT